MTRTMTTATLVGAIALAGPVDEVEAIDANRVVVYKEIDEIKLRLYVFEPADHTEDADAPALVLFFGGGWKGGTPKQFEPHAKYFASRGMVVVLADYRVSGKHKTTPIECVKDGCSAMRYVRVHAEKWGIDPARIAAGGGSAGGHVAAATATITAFNEASDDLEVSCVPAALALFNPVYDNGPGGYGYDRVKAYWRKFSPLHNVREGIPPSITLLGTKDKLIPVETAKRWKRAVEKVGGRADVHCYEGAGHGFFNHGRDGNQHYLDTVEKVDRFFISLKWLAGEPTIGRDE